MFPIVWIASSYKQGDRNLVQYFESQVFLFNIRFPEEKGNVFTIILS